MIEANELRIGNWVEPQLSKYGKVEMIEYVNPQNTYLKISSIQYTDNGATHIDMVKPILLTKAILEKCGLIIGSRIEIWIESLQVSRSIYLDGILNGGIEYLHQFQNLYFDLTGEELEIDL